MLKDQKLIKVLKFLFGMREMALVLVLLVIGVLMTTISPVFLSPLNLRAILMALSVEAPITVGMVILLISGGLDLSVGSPRAFAGVAAGLSLNACLACSG